MNCSTLGGLFERDGAIIVNSSDRTRAGIRVGSMLAIGIVPYHYLIAHLVGVIDSGSIFKLGAWQ